MIPLMKPSHFSPTEENDLQNKARLDNRWGSPLIFHDSL